MHFFSISHPELSLFWHLSRWFFIWKYFCFLWGWKKLQPQSHESCIKGGKLNFFPFASICAIAWHFCLILFWDKKRRKPATCYPNFANSSFLLFISLRAKKVGQKIQRKSPEKPFYFQFVSISVLSQTFSDHKNTYSIFPLKNIKKIACLEAILFARHWTDKCIMEHSFEQIPLRLS